MKKIAILGSTGSIGTQTLDVVRANGDIQVLGISAGRNVERLEAQIREFHPRLVAVWDEKAAKDLSVRAQDLPVRVVSGMDGLLELAAMEETEILVTAIVGMLGIRPTMEAIRAGKDIALANKETLVTAGHLIMPMAKENGVRILPVDSEHSAVFQALNGEKREQVHKLLITASGGPFRGRKRADLENVTLEDTLKHPNWVMGQKITIDSATLFNKALEIMEAKWLFGVEDDRIQVVVHPQSVIHSGVQFADGALIAQLGTPDMRLPILYAMSYPERLPTGGAPLDLFSLSGLTFERPDPERFPSLRLARECLRAGGAACCELNAANEAAVAHLLQQPLQPAGGKCMTIGRIYEVVEETLNRLGVLPAGSLDEILEADRRARDVAASLLAAD